MKQRTITVNKTPQQPEGVTIEIVEPQSPLEERILGAMLANMLSQTRERKLLKWDLPAGFNVQHQQEGTFVVMTLGGVDEGSGGLYQQPRPVAIVGLRAVGEGFDIIHAPVPQQAAVAESQPRAEGDEPA